jgi:hypothetical protein
MEPNERKTWTTVVLVVLTIGYLIEIGDLLSSAGWALLPSYGPGPTWPFWRLVVVTSPLAILLFLAVAWLLYWRRLGRAAVVAALLPLAWVGAYCTLFPEFCPLTSLPMLFH